MSVNVSFKDCTENLALTAVAADVLSVNSAASAEANAEFFKL